MIVGGGPVGHRVAERLRHHGHDGPVTLLDAEPGPAYHRVLLPALLDGSLTPADLRLPDLPDVNFRHGVSAAGIDRRLRQVRTTAHDRLPYDTLVLATGARPHLPPVPGLRHASGWLIDGVTGLRSRTDCTRVRGDDIVVLGGGPLGVETAAALRRAGRRVTLVHPGPYPLDDRLDADAGALLTRHLAGLGVELELGRVAAGVQPGKLSLDDEWLLAWDTLLCCTGVRPRTGLAEAAGLAVRTGVLVDAAGRTSDPAIRAVGDCTEPGGSLLTGWEQAEAVARSLTGKGVPRGLAAGRRPVFRLRVPGLTLGVLGDGRGGGGDEIVTYRDPARSRYARLALDPAGRLRAAVLTGLPQALATLTQLYTTDTPLPESRLALLLGRPAPRTGPLPELPPEAVVCRCNNVTKGALTEAWDSGARTAEALAEATRATTGCGSCVDDIRGLCREFAGSTA
ncbi:FAD-dependent oxidoreductase [Streptomyces sp. CMB-StM0423]|uniref:FAD-dependent oxidoreductase n=1 Tax=Streptomyces sp. CMB-StM0423 TaxID=2059884 RepID=UPI000C70AC12|nr:FAD-dependent oxidoreductase [Streptomyces sp. CMB-StM0423]AUH40855.1 NAD(P)/FAD-dependent oxidoreductase [Streptomyces sp. CMB-StM0423]